MVPAALLLLAAVPIERQTAPPPASAAGVPVRAVASAEIMRVGRVGGQTGSQAGPEDVIAPLRIARDGRLIAEFR